MQKSAYSGPLEQVDACCWRIPRSYKPGMHVDGLIFASETLGDFLLWYLPSEYPILLYTHVQAFTPEHCQNCLKVKFGAPGWRDYLDAQRVNLVVVEAEGHPTLRDRLKKDRDWVVLVDETGQKTKPVRQRLLIALRQKPL